METERQERFQELEVEHPDYKERGNVIMLADRRKAKTPAPRAGRELKNRQFMVRVSDTELRTIHEQAYAHGEVSASNWARKILLRVAAGWRIVPPDGTQQAPE